MTRRTVLSIPTVFARSTAVEVAIAELTASLEHFAYRLPYQFGGKTVDRVTILNVEAVVRTRAGKTARGFGSMPLGNVWAYPSKSLSYDETLAEMVALSTRLVALARNFRDFGHPFDLHTALEPDYLRAGGAMPKLAVLVTASPIDAAIHDAYGKLLGRSCYETYGPDCVRRDLSAYLGPDFRGQTLTPLLRRRPAPRTIVYHSVGGADPILEEDVRTRLNDGLPNSLAEWIVRDDLTHLKIKLQGGDLDGDVERVLRVERAAAGRPCTYCLDFNENCPNVDYLLRCLARIREKAPRAFASIQYVEQPTKRDLRADQGNVMFEAAKLCPVVIDESLTDLESLLLARDMGYTGLALKACKGQTQALLMAAAARRYGMFLCVQDLTCPGASFIHSAGLAAWIQGISTLEANARQYVPAANAGWVGRFPSLFEVRGGAIGTGVLGGPGLGAVTG